MPASRWLAVALILLAAAYTVVCVLTSERIGRLSSPPSYDDVRYFIEAANQLKRLEVAGVAAVARDLVADSPHAPSSRALGLLGFGVLGVEPKSAYLANVFVVLPYVFGAAFLLRDVAPLARLLWVAAFLCLPIATMAVVEFRPDILWAVVVGFSTVWIVTEARLDERRDAVIAGVLLGLGLLAKPSTFAMTGLVTVLACAAAYLRERPVRGLRSAALMVAAVCVVAGPYWMLHGLDTVRYFIRYAWIEAETFNLGIDPDGYYLYGQGAASNLGAFYVALPLFVGAAALRDLVAGPRRARIEAAAIAGILLVALTLNETAKLKAPHLAGAYYGTMAFYAAHLANRAAVWLGAHTGRPAAAQLATGALALAVGLGFYRWPEYSDLRAPWQENCRTFDTWAKSEIEKLASRRLAGRRPLLLVSHVGPVIPHGLIFWAEQRGLELDVDSTGFARTIEEARTQIDGADLVLAEDRGIHCSARWTPGDPLQDEIVRALETDRCFRRAAERADALGERMYLYTRIAPCPPS